MEFQSHKFVYRVIVIFYLRNKVFFFLMGKQQTFIKQ